MFSRKQLPMLLMVTLSVAVFVAGVLLYQSPPALLPGSAIGLQTLQSMEAGSAFNTLVSADHANIAHNAAEFVISPSPGQYLLPYSIRLLTGCNTGHALAISTSLCLLLGMWAFWLLFQRFGFSPLLSAASVCFIACQHFFTSSFVYFDGEELLQFAFLGWFLLYCLAADRTSWRFAAFLFVSAWVGFFCHPLFVWLYIAAIIYVWQLASKPGTVRFQQKLISIVLPAFAALSTIWIFYLARGINPISGFHGFNFSLKTLCFPIASPLISGFSADAVFHRLFYPSGQPAFSGSLAIIVLLVLMELSLWLLLGLLKQIPFSEYTLLLRVGYLAAIAFFSIAFLAKMPVSYEARHFRIIGLLLVPGTIFLFQQGTPLARFFFYSVWAAIFFFSLQFFVRGYDINKNDSAHGRSGVPQRSIDQQSLNTIVSLDGQANGATFVFVDRQLSLEVLHHRVIVLQPVSDNLVIDFDDYLYSGHNGPLYLFLPDSYAGPKEKFILKGFPGYKGWYASMLGNRYVVYSAK